MIPWHRLFGLLLSYTLKPFNLTVELEKDLSVQQQFLDGLIIRQQRLEPTH